MIAPVQLPVSESQRRRTLAGLLLQAHWLIGDVARQVGGRRASGEQLIEVAELCDNIAGTLRRYAATLPSPTVEGPNDSDGSGNAGISTR